MTKIKYKQLKNSFQIVADGHAGYAAYGSDIVCASVSILLQTLMARLDDVCDKCTIDVLDGHVEIYAEGGMESFRTILTGLQMIAEEYPSHVSIEGCPIISQSEMK